MIDRLYVLWRHFSSWFLYAIIALGSLQEFSVGLADFLPHWVLVLLAFGALAAKLIPQKLPQPKLDDVVEDRRRA